VAPLDVAPVRSAGDLRAFIALPYELNRTDATWVPPLRRDVKALLSRRVNPFFEHGEAEYFLARRGGKVVGRIAAVHNRLHNEFQHDQVGFFGLLDLIDDPAVAAALFDAAAAWLRPRGLDAMRGPASFSTNDECGLLIDGFETPPVVLMAHNPRYYVSLVEGAGFGKAKDFMAYRSTSDKLPQRLVDGVNLLARRYQITSRCLDMRRYEEEVALIKRLYNAAWEKNWGFVPMTDREIDHLAKQLRPVVVPELVVFAESRGQAIGFGVALPDLNVALRANPSGRFFPGILKVLWASRRIDRLRVVLLGMLPEWRTKAVDALLYKTIWEHAVGRGYRWAEAGWILENNHPMRNGVANMGFEVYKTYRMYERPL
jgi:GNAT superfamily N-acetyltransferase